MLEEMELKDVRVIGLENAERELDAYKSQTLEGIASMLVAFIVCILVVLFIICSFSGFPLKLGLLVGVFLIVCSITLVKHLASNDMARIKRADKELKRLANKNNIGDVKYTIITSNGNVEYTIFVNGVKTEFLKSVVHKPTSEIPVLDYNKMMLVVNYAEKG